jgi:cell shape-determining protein MreC
MATVVNSRTARRRGVAFGTLVVISVLLMVFSSNPYVRTVQNGMGFALRPIAAAFNGVASSVASIGASIAEIDRLRVDNTSLRSENQRLAVENTCRRSLARTPSSPTSSSCAPASTSRRPRRA